MPAKKKKAEDKQDKIASIVAAINKERGDGTVFSAGSDSRVQVQRFSSGHPDLDDALGGGWPKARIIELYGAESGGKSTTCFHAIASHQAEFPDEPCAILDTENSMDAQYAADVGVDVDSLIIHQQDPESGAAEELLNVLKTMIIHGVKMIVVDSVAGLVSQTESSGEFGDQHMALQARLMSKALKEITSLAGKHDCTIFFTNQLREKIGVMFGDKKTTSGGNALKFYASVRVNIVKIKSKEEVQKIDGEEVVVSSRSRLTVQKSKVSPPLKSAEVCITFGWGFDLEAGVLEKALKRGIITRKGSWFSMDGEQIGQGSAKVLELLRSDASLLQNISDRLKESTALEVETEEPEEPAKRGKVFDKIVEKMEVGNEDESVEESSVESC